MHSDKHAPLAGKVAIVTGGSRNIGRAICEALSAQGARVTVNALNSTDDAEATVAAITSAGGLARTHLADVTDPDAVRAMIGATEAEWGSVSILVNCASIREEWPFEEIRLEDWRRVVSIILDGAFVCAQAVVPGMRSLGGGAIVNIGGETGHSGARERAHVVTAKAGLAGFTKALALDLAPDGIHVCCVAPGAMDTVDSRMVRHPNSRFSGKRMPPIGRRGTAGEIGSFVAHLCGPAGVYATGQTFHLNGGHHLA